MSTLIISSGTVSSGLVVTAGETLFVISGGQVQSSTVQSGGLALISAGGSATDLTILSGGSEVISSGGVGVGDVVSGVEVVRAGGTESSATVASGGTLNLTSGGVVSGATVNSGGRINVSSGGIGSGVTINSGGVEIVFTGGGDNATTLNGGELLAFYGATVSNVVDNGGLVVLYTAAQESNVTIGSGGSEQFYSGASAAATVVSSGAELFLVKYNLSNSAAYAGPISATTVMGGFTLSSGAKLDYSFPVINAGATLTLGSGATGDSAIVNSGGVLQVQSGAESDYATVQSGGAAFVATGGSVFQIVVSGGELVISPGAVLTSVTVKSGASLFLAGGTVSSGAKLSTGVSPNEVVSGAHLVSGALLELAGVTVIAGGTLEVGVGGDVGPGQINFAGSGTLVTDAGAAPQDLISGLGAGDTIDVKGVQSPTLAFNSATDMLTLTGTSGSIQLNIAGPDAGRAFSTASDGGNGTLLTAPLDAPGTYSVAGAGLATIDPAGTYSGPGASAPILDPVGTYGAAPGAAAPTLADPGYYVPTVGATTELIDPAGTYSGPGASAPILDPVGTYGATPGAASPTLADPGYYVPTVGATAELIDPAGSYSGPGASAPTLADPGYYVPTAGASAELIDPAGTYSGAGATSYTIAPAPILAGSGGGAPYVVGGTVAAMVAALTVAEPAPVQMVSATVAISGGFLAGDTLNFINQGGITGVYNATTGVLSLTGAASAATYQQALDSITYSSTATDPTAGDSDLSRTISFTLSDGLLASNVQTVGLNLTGQTFILKQGAHIVGAAADDTVIIAKGTLSATDYINGGGGVNTLAITGGGGFDLRLPSTLVNFSIVTAQEGQAAYNNVSPPIATTQPTIYLRNGLPVTLVLSPNPAPNPNNPNPSGAVIYGAANADLIDLGPGADTVVLGGAAETVNGGSGAATIKATAATAGALLTGGAGGMSVSVSGGGVVNLNSADTGLGAITLVSSTTAYQFAANNQVGLVITDHNATVADTIALGGPGQTVTGGGPSMLTITESAAGGDTFRDAVTVLNGDTIVGFASPSNVIDVTNLTPANALNATFGENAAGTAGQLNLFVGKKTYHVALIGQFMAAGFSGAASSAGFATASDGAGGTNITYMAVPHMPLPGKS